jgi:peptide-methionine (R)-S-oxide reductase
MKAALLFAATIALAACQADEPKKTVMETSEKAPEQPVAKVEKTDEQWRKELTPEQYRILRQAGTERPFGEVYKEFKEQGEGTYYCAGCNAELFTSTEKFDSHCGWPSFYDPSKAKNVITRDDLSGGMVRTEVLCAKCNGHLGHVFTGEGFDTPTDQRYCINGVALKFVPGKPAAQNPAPEPEKEAATEGKPAAKP